MVEKEDALTKTYDLMLWLFPQVGKFPKEYRFILGERIEKSFLDVCGWLIEARYTKDKAAILARVNMELEKLRYQARLLKDLKIINLRKYEYFSKELNQAGLYVGGWLKSVKGRGTDEKGEEPL